MLSSTLHEKMREFRNKTNVKGTAIITKEGVPIALDIPTSIHEETFNVMCATMFAAAGTAHSEVDEKSSIKSILIEGEKCNILLMPISTTAILGAVFEKNINTSVMKDAVEDFVAFLRGFL